MGRQADLYLFVIARSLIRRTVMNRMAVLAHTPHPFMSTVRILPKAPRSPQACRPEEDWDALMGLLGDRSKAVPSATNILPFWKKRCAQEAPEIL